MLESMLGEWKFWVFLMGAINSCLTITGFLVIKYNDFQHMGKDLKRLESKVDAQGEQINNIKMDVAVLKERTTK